MLSEFGRLTSIMATKASNTGAGGKSSSRGASNQQVARAGEHFVAAELNKRGAYAVTFAGNMPKIDLLACNADQLPIRPIRFQFPEFQAAHRERPPIPAVAG